jgi:hypothetical protein
MYCIIKIVQKTFTQFISKSSPSLYVHPQIKNPPCSPIPQSAGTPGMPALPCQAAAY